MKLTNDKGYLTQRVKNIVHIEAKRLIPNLGRHVVIVGSFAIALVFNLYVQCQHEVSSKPATEWSVSQSTAVSSISMSADMLIAYGTDDCRAFVWSVHPNKLVGAYNVYPLQSDLIGGITSVYVLAGRHEVVIACRDGTTMAFSTQSGKAIYHHRTRRSTELRFSQLLQGGQQLAIATSRRIRFMTASDHSKTWSWRIPGSGVESASVSPNGRLLATGDTVGNVLLLDTRSHQVIASTKGVIDSAGSNFSQNENEFICSSPDNGQILFWSRKRPRNFQQINIPSLGWSRIALSPDGRLLAISDQTSYATIWKIDSVGGVTRDLYMLGPHHNYDTPHLTTCITFSPDSQALLLGDRDGSVVMWNFKQGTHIILRGNEPRL